MENENLWEILPEKNIVVLSNRHDNKLLAQNIAKNLEDDFEKNPFFVTNLSLLIDQFLIWKNELPDFRPFYAVKCNNDPVILKVLAMLGCGFDCASKNEIKLALSLGNVKPEDIIYANPNKTKDSIILADEIGLKKMTFDNVEELYKIKELHKNPEMIVRIAVNDLTAQCQLGGKFGCEPEKVAPQLLKEAAKLGIAVIGISFHVGSGCNDPDIFKVAIKHAKDLFDLGNELKHKMTLLDIGGGFPGLDSVTIRFSKIAHVIKNSIKEHFSEYRDLELISEPGRFFAHTPVSLAVNVITGTKVPKSRITQNENDSSKEAYMYYVNQGTYGCFNCKIFDHYLPVGEPLHSSPGKDQQTYLSTIWGPSCSKYDQVEKLTEIRKLDSEEWLFYPTMGAYTIVTSSMFNGFELPDNHHFIDEKSL